MRPLTSRQREIVAFIRGFAQERGYAPTWREIGDALGIKSQNGVSAHLLALQRKGAVTWEHGRSRTLRVLVEA